MLTRLSKLAFIAVTSLAGLTPLVAEPFIDNFDTLSYVHNDSGTCVITQLDDGQIQVTNNGERGPQVSFGWSNKGFTSTSTLSPLPEDAQSVLQVEGIKPLKGTGVQAKLSAALMFGDGTEELKPYKDGNPAFFVPVEPDDKGTWRLDVGKFVQESFDENERPKAWAVQFIMNTEDQPETGYSFTSISAVSSEP